MKTLLLVVALAPPALAHAQVFTAPDSVPQPTPICWPERIGGIGKGFTAGQIEVPVGESIAKGQWAGWWCELPGEPRGQWRMASLWGGLNYAVIHPDYPAGSNMAQIAAAYWTANVKTMPDPPVERWHINMNAAIVTALSMTRPATPPTPSWVVTPALSGTRPLFSIVNGALVATTQRVTALASPATLCDCDAAQLTVPPATY